MSGKSIPVCADLEVHMGTDGRYICIAVVLFYY